MIVIASKGRPENVERLFRLLGEDIVFFVHESERDVYSRFGARHIETHQIEGSMAKIRNQIMDKYAKDSWVCMMDDDLRGVLLMAHDKPKRTENRDDILQIIENGAAIAMDAGAPFFGWSLNPLPFQFYPHDPFRCVAPVAGAIIATPNSTRCDVRLSSFEDVDMVMSALREKRYVLVDHRFLFDFGGVWKGKGGLQSVRTKETEMRDREFLNAKWGRYLMVDCKKGRKVASMSIRVTRKNPLVCTK